MSDQKPTVGLTVHYVSYGTPGGEYGKKCRAAKVTDVVGRAVDPQTGADTDAYVVGLCVLNPTGMFFNQSVVEDKAGRSGGTWHHICGV